jgi:hypothetical protein
VAENNTPIHISMFNLLAAPDLVPYKKIRTGHEGKFSNFLVFVGRADLAGSSQMDKSAYVIQVGDGLAAFRAIS